MKKTFNLIGILLVITVALVSCRESTKQKIIGEWEGVDSKGKKASLVFDKNGYVTLVMGNLVLGGSNMKGRGSLKYEIDYSKDPITLDLIVVDPSGKELGKIAMIAKLITYDKIQIRTFFNDSLPEEFKIGDDKNTIVLNRIGRKRRASPARKAQYILEPSYRVIFTTGLTENNDPVNDLQEISINEERIYIYVTWYFLSDEEHDYLCKIFDGAGTLISTYKMSFTPEGGSYHTWTWYSIKKYVDKPGNWKFEIYLDGRKVIEENLTVLSE